MSTAAKGRSGSDLSYREIRKLVDEGGKLAKIVRAGERAQPRLDAIKVQLRELADNNDRDFVGAKFVASVECKADAVCRVLDEEEALRVLSTVEPKDVIKLFTLHPSKGAESNVETNFLKVLTKRGGETLIARLMRATTPWVRFRRKEKAPQLAAAA
jgi:hypothetical protein